MSGGLDSAVLLARLLAGRGRIAPVYVQTGLRWEAVEVYWLRRLLRAVHSAAVAPLRVIQLPLRRVYGSHWSLSGRQVPSARSRDAAVYLPAGNVLLATAAAIYCEPRGLSTIAFGTLKGNPFGDATPRFFSTLSDSLTQALRHPIRLVAPLRRLRKSDLIRSAGSWPLDLTFSCLQPQGRFHCGRCNKCAERARAFREADVADPTRYAV